MGIEEEHALDIPQLRAKTGFVTLDPAFMNTASTKSAITFLDGEKGILRYRGIPIEQLAEQSTFVETSYLLIYGHLPSEAELQKFSTRLTRHSLIHEDMKRFFDGFPSTAHPMAVLSSMVVSLSSFYPDALDVDNKDRSTSPSRGSRQVRTIAAFAYKKSIGQPFVYPKNSLSYCANFLNMMFSVPAEPYEVDPEVVKVMNLLLILHADHEQNCSTSTVRLVGSAKANLFASISAGICALWGPLHGGANQEVIEMLEKIKRTAATRRSTSSSRRTRTRTSASWASATASTRTSTRARRSSRARPTRSSPRSASRTRSSTSPRRSRRPRSRTATSSSESSTRTSISTRASSTGRSASPPTCSPSSSRWVGSPAGSPTGRR